MRTPAFINRTLPGIILLMMLASCSNRKAGYRENQVIADSSGHFTGEDRRAGTAERKFRVAGDSVIVPEFIIRLQLSGAAEKKLRKDHESIIVQAYFSGEPKDTTSVEFMESGGYSVGSYRIELWDTRTARFDRVKILKASLDSICDKNFEVLINVFSGRHSTDQNILDCDILQEKILTVAGKKFVLNGKLIGEN